MPVLVKELFEKSKSEFAVASMKPPLEKSNTELSWFFDLNVSKLNMPFVVGRI